MMFNEKVAIVTGGSSGIGKEAALAFGKEGSKVVVALRRKIEGEETVQQIINAGGEAIFINTDVTQTDQVQKMVQTVMDHYGKLNIAFFST